MSIANTLLVCSQQVTNLLQRRSFDASSAEQRANERHRRVALSALASIFARGVSIGTTLVSVPLTLHYLGPERYGMWMVMSSLVAFLSFADLGVGNGVLTLVAAVSGKDDIAAIKRIASSSFFVLSLIAVLLIAALTCSYPFIHWFKLFNVRSDLARNEAGAAFSVFLCSIALAIPLGVVQKLQTGLQQGFIVSLWQCLGNLMGLAGVLVVIWLRGGMTWLVFSLVTVPMFATALNNIGFFWVARPDLRPRLAFVERATMVRVARTGALFLVLQIAVAFTFASDSIIISQVLGAAAVADYAVPEKMFSLISVLVSMFTAPLWPAYGEAISRGDRDWVRRTLLRSITLSALLASTMSVFLVFFGPRILALWIGRLIDPPFALLLGFGIWKAIEACGMAVAVYLNGAQVVGVQVVTASLTAICAISLKIFFLSSQGLAGVIWATIVAYGICTALPITWFLLHHLSKGKSDICRSQNGDNWP